MAAVVEPVGLKAYWSEKESGGEGLKKQGYRYLQTTIFSKALDNTGVIEIGLKSLVLVGGWTLGRGLISADFHCVGTVEVSMDRFRRYES